MPLPVDPKSLRLDGIYQQRQQPYFMRRIKLPGGIISCEQAVAVAEIAEDFARGVLHLTTRRSIELHWLDAEALAAVSDRLCRVGLTSRGACGGAVRGVTVAAPDADPSTLPYVAARFLQQYFTGHPAYETLPKKFKIGIQAGYDGLSCHLIQDVGLVVVDHDTRLFDVWMAGGLGREPQEAFLLEAGVPENRILPLVEAVLRLYAQRGTAGKRLKHLVREVGETACRELVLSAAYDLPEWRFPQVETVSGETVEAYIFAGELTAVRLRQIAEITKGIGLGWLSITSDQNVAVQVPLPEAAVAVRRALQHLGFEESPAAGPAVFRICPGSHECRVGLAATRDIARRIVSAADSPRTGETWAISGCPNSCAQPQLADVGIVATRLVKKDEGEMAPLFDLYRGGGKGRMSEAVARGIDEEELLRRLAS